MGKTAGTRVYGASDDLIEFEGDVDGEVGSYGTDDREHGVLVTFSDGTILEVKYGKADMGVWEVKAISRGPLFREIVPCDDEDANPHSDVAHFDPGLKWAYAATEWERVK